MLPVENFLTLVGNSSQDVPNNRSRIAKKKQITSEREVLKQPIDLSLERAKKLVKSGELSSTNQRVLQILISKYPYIAKRDCFSNIWPEISEQSNPNILQLAISRLRKHIPIYTTRGIGYSLNKSPQLENTPDWIVHFTPSEQKILNYFAYKSGQLDLTNMYDLLCDHSSEEMQVDEDEYQQLMDNIVNLNRSRLDRKLQELGLGSFTRIRGEGIFVLNLYAESLQQAAD